MAWLRQPPASWTAVVEAPRRTSSDARPRRPECDETPSIEAERGGQDLDAAVDLVRTERDDAVGRGGRRRRAQLVDGTGEGADEQAEVLAAAVGVGLRGPPSAGRGRRRRLPPPAPALRPAGQAVAGTAVYRSSRGSQRGRGKDNRR